MPDRRVLVRGGTFRMGDDGGYPEEGPARTVAVDPFWIDAHEVTNAQFGAFVRATGYRTIAEREAGSAVFLKPDRPPARAGEWWAFVPAASWRRPLGSDGPAAAPRRPVVHVAFEDAEAYARWAGARLPTEAEWEFAARAGDAADRAQPVEANSWQGPFPLVDEAKDGFAALAPVGCYRPNRLGLHDMIGNAWEWFADQYAIGHDPKRPLRNPSGPEVGSPARVIKGGSFLCAPNYCIRYRTAARAPAETGLGTSHIGFRTVVSADRQ